MPIKIPKGLPAHDILSKEGVMVMSETSAERQDIRPLKIALLNLMPLKAKTETQFARLIGSTPLQLELTLVSMSNHKSKNTSATHMNSFYKSFKEVKNKKFDGLIITGAPIEHLDFNAVNYWNELKIIFEWTQLNVHSTFAVCWGAMAMLNHFFNIEKYMLPNKVFGCYEHRITKPNSSILRGFSDEILVPVSRWSEMKSEDFLKLKGLEILIDSNEIGPCLVEDKIHRAFYVFNHFEYDKNTLGEEYFRDKNGNKSIKIPKNYYPNDDITKSPQNIWRSHAHLLYGNWINEIYQTSPYEISKIGEI